jgi:Fanconi-associated nuclease 1
LVGLIEAMGSSAGHHLSAIMSRLGTNYRHTKGGMPDLCLWNRENKEWVLVEVKGPNDKLSTKQVTVD